MIYWVSYNAFDEIWLRVLPLKAACQVLPVSKIVCDIGSPGITFNPYVCLFVY